MEKINTILLTALVLLVGLLVFTNSDSASPLGSVSVSNEYHATTTGDTATSGGMLDTTTIKTAAGTIGSVVITGTNNGTLQLYDATTSDNNLRASAATSSLILVTIPVDSATGTYTYDVEAIRGIMLVTEGSAPTSTITWR